MKAIQIGGVKMLNKFLMTAGLCLFFVFTAESQVKPLKCLKNEIAEGALCVETKKIPLVQSDNFISIKIYTKRILNKPIDRTFVVVHANEEKGLDAAKKVVSENYGRLVEVVSNYVGESVPEDNKRRKLYFGENQKYCIDPNRIYTKVGIAKNLSDCQTIPNNEIDRIFKFGQELIKIVTNDNRHKFIIGVHNNGLTKLSLDSWGGENGDERKSAVGIFKANDHRSGKVVETGNFLLVSNTALFVKFSSLEEPSNIVLQESQKYLTEATGENKGKIKKNLDDGSMSIYFGSTNFGKTGKPFDYINIEAEGKENTDDGEGYKKRQMRIIELVITKLKI